MKVLSSHAVMEVLNALGPAFERESGVKLSVSYDPANVLKRRIDDGEAFDVAIATRAVLDALVVSGKILAHTRVDLGRSGLGVSVRKGMAKPNIATVESFKTALLAAKSIVRSRDGASGIYFAKLLDKLGLAEALRDRIVLGPSGRVAALVANGETELAVQQISELLPVEGADFVGPFPRELQLYSMFSAGIGSGCKQRAPAKQLLSALASPAAAVLFKASGLEPV